jgi:hypothetical protein
MTSFEHAMLGINGVMAAGLHRKCGYQIVAMAAVAAVIPDWDGATILVSRWAFVEGHRVWGHNVLACLIMGIAIGWLDYRFDLATRVSRFLSTWMHVAFPAGSLQVRDTFTSGGLFLWISVAYLATMSHLVGDLVVSGTKSLPDWSVQLLWPFSDRGWVFPMVAWGDVGITLVFVGGMFAMLRWRARTQMIAVVTLVGVATYLGVRGWF